MTKTIKINAIIAPVLLITGTFLKTTHSPGANVVLVFGAAAGIMLFILLITSLAGKFPSRFEKFNGILASLTLIIALLAFIFKVMHWPGAAKLIWIADIGILLTGILFLVESWREKDPFKLSMKIITVFFILLLFLVIMLAK